MAKSKNVVIVDQMVGSHQKGDVIDASIWTDAEYERLIGLGAIAPTKDDVGAGPGPTFATPAHENPMGDKSVMPHAPYTAETAPPTNVPAGTEPTDNGKDKKS